MLRDYLRESYFLRGALDLADEKVVELGHEYTGPEHFLLGLIEFGKGSAYGIMRVGRIDFENIKSRIGEMREGHRENRASKGFTPRAKKAYGISSNLSLEIVESCGAMRTGHLLLGILGEGESIACQMLSEQGMRYERVFSEYRRLIGELKEKRDKKV